MCNMQSGIYEAPNVITKVNTRLTMHGQSRSITEHGRKDATYERIMNTTVNNGDSIDLWTKMDDKKKYE